MTQMTIDLILPCDIISNDTIPNDRSVMMMADYWLMCVMVLFQALRYVLLLVILLMVLLDIYYWYGKYCTLLYIIILKQ